MVKYGYCKLYCKECGAGVAIQTNIQRDKSWEKNIISTKCAHFEFWCDLYTYDSFNPYKDQIQFKTFAKCLRCEQVNEESISCIGFENRVGDLMMMKWNWTMNGKIHLKWLSWFDLKILFGNGFLYGILPRFLELKPSMDL